MIATDTGLAIQFTHETIFVDPPGPIRLDARKVEARTTICTLVNKSNEIVAEGEAFCHVNDQFNKETGRKLALARALKESELSQESRALIWQAYFSRLPEAKRRKYLPNG